MRSFNFVVPPIEEYKEFFFSGRYHILYRIVYSVSIASNVKHFYFFMRHKRCTLQGASEEFTAWDALSDGMKNPSDQTFATCRFEALIDQAYAAKNKSRPAYRIP